MSLGIAKAEVDSHGMTNVEDSIWLRGKACDHLKLQCRHEQSRLHGYVHHAAASLSLTLPPVSFRCCWRSAFVFGVTIYPSVISFSPIKIGIKIPLHAYLKATQHPTPSEG